MSEEKIITISQLAGNITALVRHRHRDGEPDYNALRIDIEEEIAERQSLVLSSLRAEVAALRAEREKVITDLKEECEDLRHECLNHEYHGKEYKPKEIDATSRPAWHYGYAWCQLHRLAYAEGLLKNLDRDFVPTTKEEYEAIAKTAEENYFGEIEWMARLAPPPPQKEGEG